MGIRFHCPTCSHKLNVKAFLAGKRGVCPECGAGLDIPLESQIHKKEGAGKKRATKPPGRDRTESVGSVDLMAVPVSAPVSVDDVRITVPSGPELTIPAANVKDEAPAASPVASVATTAAPLAPTRKAVPVQPVTPVEPVTPVATPVPAAPLDPIEEAPESSWYVRPPSGGQYGPARGEIMRKWITEGRVSADSLVWREGWDDWLTATDVFPSLGSVSMPPVPAPAPGAFAPASPAPTHSSSSLRPRRPNSSAKAISIVVVLGLFVVALLVALIVVWKNS